MIFGLTMQTTTQRTTVNDESTRRAAHCRRLAGGALPYQLVRELEALADEYERRAAQPVKRTPALRRWLAVFRHHIAFPIFPGGVRHGRIGS